MRQTPAMLTALALVMGLAVRSPAQTGPDLWSRFTGLFHKEAPAPRGYNRLVEITVELALMADPMTGKCPIRARTTGAMVQLEGPVPNQQVRQRALYLARRASGMTVADRLKEQGRPGPAVNRVAAVQLHREAQARLRSVSAGRNFQLHCEDSGKIRVTGWIHSFEDKLALSRALLQVPGCTCVDNAIEVGIDSRLARPTAQKPPIRTILPARIAVKPPEPKKNPETTNRDQGFLARVKNMYPARKPEQPLPQRTDTNQPAIFPLELAKTSAPMKTGAPTIQKVQYTQAGKDETKPASPAAQKKTPVRSNLWLPGVISPYSPEPAKKPAPLPGELARNSTPLKKAAGNTGPAKKNPSLLNGPELKSPALQKVQFAPPGKETKPAPFSRPAMTKPRQPFVSHGFVIVAEEPAVPAVNPYQEQVVREKINRACGKSARNIQVQFQPANKVAISFKARNRAEANQLAQRIMFIPELLPYRVDVWPSVEP